MLRTNYRNSIIILLHFCTSLILAFNAACDIYFLTKSDIPWNVKFGQKVGKPSANTGYYTNMNIIFWMLISLFFFVAEIAMIFKVDFFYVNFYTTFYRPIIYIIIGIINFGICNDLGITAGAFLLIMGVVWLILTSFAAANMNY